MPRRAGTITVTMGLNPKSRRVSQMVVQARERGQSLSAYARQLVLDLTSEGSFVPLRFQEASHVRRSLEQEARSLEMELADYLQTLLADRHRALYSGYQQASLWYPRGVPVGASTGEATASQGTEEIDMDEAMKNVEHLVGFYAEMDGF